MSKHICACCMNEVEFEGGICFECQDAMNADMEAGFKEMDRIQRRQAFRVIFTQRCKPEREYNLNRVQRWYYTAKALVCMLLRRRRSLWPAEGYEVGFFNYNGGYGASWDELRVGAGIFRDWHYDIYNNGD